MLQAMIGSPIPVFQSSKLFNSSSRCSAKPLSIKTRSQEGDGPFNRAHLRAPAPQKLRFKLRLLRESRKPAEAHQKSSPVPVISQLQRLYSQILQWLKKIAAVGGALAILLTLSFSSSQRSHTRVYDLVHPPLASIQTQVGYSNRISDEQVNQIDNPDYEVDYTIQRAELYSSASEVPNPRAWSCWVSDQARVLSREAVEHLNSVIDALEYDTGTEITVVTVKSLDSRVSSKEFASELYRVWKMERESQGRGLVLLVNVSEKRLEVEVGWNLFRVLKGDGIWDYESSGWMNSLVRRSREKLQRGDCESAVVQAVESVAERVWEAAGYPSTNPEKPMSLKLVDMAWLGVLPALLIVSQLSLWNSLKRSSISSSFDPEGNDFVTGKLTRRQIRKETL